MKIFTLFIALLLAGSASSQIGISAGGSVLKGFGQPTPWAGFHIGVEVPRDDAVTIFGRLSHHFSQENLDPLTPLIAGAEAYNPATNPNYIFVEGVSSMNYTVLEGGTRYYLGNGYDFGWAAYGGTELMLIFNSVKNEYTDYDQVLYKLDDGYSRKGSIVSLGAGLGGGVKYSIENVGTVYFDVNLTYMLLGLPSANDFPTDQYSQLLFNFNLGFRKDLAW